jgi:hypothetical protein
MILKVEPVSVNVVPSLPGQDVVKPPLLVLAPALADGWRVWTDGDAAADVDADGEAMGVTCNACLVEVVVAEDEGAVLVEVSSVVVVLEPVDVVALFDAVVVIKLEVEDGRLDEVDDVGAAGAGSFSFLSPNISPNPIPNASARIINTANTTKR